MVPRRSSSAFTLVELIAASALITMLMLMLVEMSRSTADGWRRGVARVEQFREAIRAYDTITRRISQATLNTYWDYAYANGVDPDNPGTNTPTGYMRQSELRFRTLRMSNLKEGTYFPTFGVFFQSPAAVTDANDTYWSKYTEADRQSVTRLDGMLNTWGYFLEVADTTADMPGFLAKSAKPRWRSRLLELREDTKDLSVYKLDRRAVSDSWFTAPVKLEADKRPAHVVAENVIAMVLLPRLSSIDEKAREGSKWVPAEYRLLSPKFEYDSKRNNNYGVDALPSSVLPYQINPKNQLPPVVEVAIVALDEASAAKLEYQALDKSTLDLPVLLDGLFQDATKLEANNDGKGDLALLADRLTARGLRHRLFVSNVALKGSRWSAAQE